MDIILFIMALILFFGGIIWLVLRPCCYECEGMAILMIIGGIILMVASHFLDFGLINQELCNCSGI